jgi:hypothetical protein
LENREEGEEEKEGTQMWCSGRHDIYYMENSNLNVSGGSQTVPYFFWFGLRFGNEE